MFQEFFTKYLAFNGDVIELLLSMASLKCFEIQPAKKHKDTNLTERIEKLTNLAELIVSTKTPPPKKT